MTVRPMGSLCAAHVHREMVPIERHHVWPLGLGGPDERGNILDVCSNAHGAIHFYLDLLRKYNGKVPWQIRRRYGRKVRAIACRGYEAWRSHVKEV